MAHPERYLYMDDEHYQWLKSINVKFQLNLFSLLGMYGKDVQVRAKVLQKKKMYNYVGSDLHKLEMLKRITKLQNQWGQVVKLKSLVLGMVVYNHRVMSFNLYRWIHFDIVFIAEFKFFPTSQNDCPPALFGDSFGAVNALISAFAFAGMIVTFVLQRYELSMQRKELESQRMEFSSQTRRCGCNDLKTPFQYVGTTAKYSE